MQLVYEKKDLSQSITWNKDDKLKTCYIPPLLFKKNLNFILECNSMLIKIIEN